MSTKELDGLLLRIAQGDNDAFEQLYIQTRRGVYAFLYTYYHNASDTEDGMQSVYLNIKKGIHTYRPGSNPSAWILQIAKNLAYNDLKKKKREVPTDEIQEDFYEYEGGRGEIPELMERKYPDSKTKVVNVADETLVITCGYDGEKTLPLSLTWKKEI